MGWPRVSPWQELVIVLLGVVIYVPLATAAPRQDKRNWDNLKELTPNEQVRIVLNDAKSYRGEFRSVSEGAIEVRVATGIQTFAQENVLRVSARAKSHRGRNALIGLAAGAGAGVIVAVASPELGAGTCPQGSCVNAGTVSMLGFWGGVLGAGVGAFLPTGGWHDVYRAAGKP